MTSTHTSRDFPAALLGPIIWAVHFLLVYALEALLCIAPTPSTDSIVRIVGGLITCAALGVLVILWFRRRGAFTTPLILLSILAVLWTSLPLFALPACTTT